MGDTSDRTSNTILIELGLIAIWIAPIAAFSLTGFTLLWKIWFALGVTLACLEYWVLRVPHNWGKGDATYYDRSIATNSNEELSIDSKLVDQKLTLTIGNGYDQHGLANQQVFDTHVWCLKIINKGPNIVRHCIAKVYFDFIGVEIPFTWKPIHAEEEEFSIGTNGSELLRDQSAEALGYKYSNELLTGKFYADLPSRIEKHLYLLFTFRDSEYAYLILPFNSEEMNNFAEEQSLAVGREILHRPNYLFATINNIPLRMPLGTSEILRIRLEGSGYAEEKSRDYALKLQSYDKVELVKL